MVENDSHIEERPQHHKEATCYFKIHLVVLTYDLMPRSSQLDQEMYLAWSFLFKKSNYMIYVIRKPQFSLTVLTHQKDIRSLLKLPQKKGKKKKKKRKRKKEKGKKKSKSPEGEIAF